MFVGIGRGTEIRVCLVPTKGVGPEATVLKGMFSPFTPIAWFNFDSFQNLSKKKHWSVLSLPTPQVIARRGWAVSVVGVKSIDRGNILEAAHQARCPFCGEGSSCEDSFNGDVLLQLHF